jgi:hypothetical protein
MACVNFTITTPTRLTGVFHPILGWKTKKPLNPYRFGGNIYTCATATAMHFPANARIIFLTDELTHDRYLVDTGATLSIVPCTSKTTPSGPLLKGADGQPIPSWGFGLKLSNFRENFFLRSFCKPLWQVPFWALTS